MEIPEHKAHQVTQAPLEFRAPQERLEPLDLQDNLEIMELQDLRVR